MTQLIMNLYRVVGFCEPYKTWMIEVTYGSEGSTTVLHVPTSVATSADQAVEWLARWH